MKAVVQRVVSASISLNGETIASIGRGLFILVGVDKNDDASDMNPIIKKVLDAKLFEDDQGGLWKQTIKECDGEILCASQFTLFAQFKGSKPDFRGSMEPTRAKEMYEAFGEACRKGYKPDKVKMGIFGSTCQISLINDGPTTLLFNTREGKATPASTSTSAAASGTATPVDNSEQIRKQEEARAAKAARKAQADANKQANDVRREQAKREQAEKEGAEKTIEQDQGDKLSSVVEGHKI